MDFLNKLDPSIDFHGQELSKKLFLLIIYLGYSISLVVGILLEDLKYTLVLGICTVIVAILVVVPSWPFYRKNPVRFVSQDKVKKEQ